MRRAIRTTLLVGAVVMSLECGGSTEPKGDPVPGNLVMTLSTPNTDDAAILLTLTGPGAPTSVTVQTGLRLFQSGGLGATTHLILTGPLTDGPLLTFEVSDLGSASSYHATIQSVSSNNYQLRTVTGYSLTISE
jgi:hypothetical protein